MGREVRRVPSDWEHPKNEKGSFIALFGRSFSEASKEWNEAWDKWSQGLCENYGDGEKWKPIPEAYRHMTYTEYSGRCPTPDTYMPEWPASEATYYMMYETTSEGTPISPAFATPEELARWLVDNNASAFADQTASYESWLRVANGGFAPSAIVDAKGLRSGVEGLT